MYQQMVIDEARAARTPVPQYAQEHRGKPVDLRIGNEPEMLAVDTKLCAELADVEANPLGELFLPEMNETSEAACVHIDDAHEKSSSPDDHETERSSEWTRFLEECKPVNRGRYRAMLMQLLQCPLMGSRGQALEECECPIREHEEQNLNTIKEVILAHIPQDPEWCRYVRLSATRLQEHDALKSVCTEKGKGKGKSKRKGKGKLKSKEKCKRKGKGKLKGEEKSKPKGKEQGKSKDKSKEGTSDTSNTECSFCKGNDCLKSLTWPAEKKTMSHEFSKLTMIHSDASVHVFPLKHGQGDSFRKSSETRPSPAAEMQQRGMRQMSCDSKVGRVTAVYRVLDMRRSIWSLRPMLDSGCDVYFAKHRC